MLDLTKEIQLEPIFRKKYIIARILLHVIFFIVAFFVLYNILFAVVTLDFSFENPILNKNTNLNPHISTGRELPKDGKFLANETLLDNASPIGEFSKASVTFSSTENNSAVENISVTINKSYQALRYPTGSPLGFKNGSLLTTPDGSYYMVSDGALRKFSNTDTIVKLGYPKSAFLEISKDDLKYNRIGNEINDTLSYPNDTIFAIGDTYFQLKDGRLFPFISVQAFLTQFDQTIAIAKSKDFFQTNPVAEKFIGFADGTLASYDVSVYILSKGKSYPIMNPETFLAMGFKWEDIIPINQNELGAYEKQKQFTHNDPHPDGTIFFDEKNEKYFLIENGKKLPITNQSIIKTYSKQKPVIINTEGLEKFSSCTLKKKLFNDGTFTCDIPLEDLNNFIGNDYQIKTTFPNATKLSTFSIKFSTPMTWNSMRNSLSKIKTKIINRQTL
ncbi:MAG: hypothetical protein US25_C0074G0002 [Candidatus Moranbacteria bacterium GW2011_GWE1_36_7]|nr:MAG: hypothetical protein UR99_C0019G0008 [Candidatus Moranbacteria bacterium GW2011_GWD2_36_12]KKQ06175.1 MAG: hypothetical protein US16_C0022G0008 [Candidatus Moranbacteria bacterium GW2011_GWE2_36_40]KKQ11739.1 MAG: hypothetical protein US25_C0074G0002 [Candidatus Moranbacteria bacterium GW2011_GWE1_36_7]